MDFNKITVLWGEKMENLLEAEKMINANSVFSYCDDNYDFGSMLVCHCSSKSEAIEHANKLNKESSCYLYYATDENGDIVGLKSHKQMCIEPEFTKKQLELIWKTVFDYAVTIETDIEKNGVSYIGPVSFADNIIKKLGWGI